MRNWYLLYCKRGEQNRAKLHLENQNIECYYPEIEIEKIVRGKRKSVIEPLFPSYIFIGLEQNNHPSFTTIRSTRGVTDFIRFGGQPYQVPRYVIEKMRRMHVDPADHESVPKTGDVVTIKTGQFAGFDAIYQEPDGEMRSILLIKMINKPVEINVDNTDVSW
ncbi:MAG: transcription/translation regulatory transformer protein RfaH [Vibrio sp.]